MMKYIMPIVAMFAFVFNADAAVKIKNNTAEKYAAQNGMEEMDDASIIATLENDIAILDEEIAKCQKQKKGWIAATVIGSAGVVATGVAAGVQGVQIKEKKDTLNEKKSDLKDLNQQKETLGIN